MRVKENELKPDLEYATMSDDLIMVHAAVELGKQVRNIAVDAASCHDLSVATSVAGITARAAGRNNACFCQPYDVVCAT